MNAELTFAYCYRVLGVAPPCTWRQVQAAYRRQIRRYHPDRCTGDAQARARAAAHSAELNRAYRMLSLHYRRNGVLPLPIPAGTAMVAHPEEQPSTRFPRLHPLLIMAGFAALAGVLWLAAGRQAPPTASLSDPAATPGAASAAPVLPAPRHHFTAGSRVDEVYAIEGVPTRVAGETWYYGPSWIRFAHGRVEAWHSEPEHPLASDPAYPLDYGSGAARRGAGAQARVWGFTIGSSAGSVYAVEGPPDAIRADQWQYGPSRVYFRGGRVTGWYSDPARPLHTVPSP